MKNQNFGVEIELTNISREKAARVIAAKSLRLDAAEIIKEEFKDVDIQIEIRYL